jgi:hypothetical protein
VQSTLLQGGTAANDIIRAHDTSPGSSFAHISNLILRRVLQAEPRQVPAADMREALSWTLDALGRDAINDDVPARALDQRIEAAFEAEQAMAQERAALCHRALRRFWSI